jgi:DNA polymerase III subunit beta
VKIRADKNFLAEAVAWTARGLPLRPTIPVLAGLLLDASGDTLTISGFDYETSATATIESEVNESGKILVSGKLLAEISRSLPDRPVEMSSTDSRLSLHCGNAKFTMLTFPVEDYPSLPSQPDPTGSISGETFAGAVQQVAVAAGKDDTLPVLTGIRVEFEGEKITLAATDRYRLAVRELLWTPETPDLSMVALIPARAFADTTKSMAAFSRVTVALAKGNQGDGLLGFSGGGRVSTSRVLDGEFPKYKSLLPESSTSVVVVALTPFLEVIKRVSLVAERNTPIRLIFRDGEVIVEAGSGHDAQASEALPAELEGDPISIAFNPGYLVDGLVALGTARVKLSFTAPNKPAVLTDGTELTEKANDDVVNYRYLLMPVRMSN